MPRADVGFGTAVAAGALRRCLAAFLVGSLDVVPTMLLLALVPPGVGVGEAQQSERAAQERGQRTAPGTGIRQRTGERIKACAIHGEVLQSRLQTTRKAGREGGSVAIVGCAATGRIIHAERQNAGLLEMRLHSSAAVSSRAAMS